MKDMTHPRITIAITCYNAADTITRAIDSACAQDWPNCEILVVDDASKDDSRARIAELIALGRNITFIPHAENKGYPAALNTLLKHATGDFIAFFDDDDVSAPNRLSQQYARLTEYEARASKDSIVLCYSNRNIVKAGENSVDHIAYAIGRHAPEPYGEPVADYLLWHSTRRDLTWGLFGSCTLFARTSVLRALGFDEAFRRSAEFDMAVRAALKGAHFIAVDAPLITQYKTPTSDKSGQIPLRYALQLRTKHKGFLQQKGIFTAANMMARHHFANHCGQKLLSAVYLGMASLCAPRAIGFDKLASRLSNKSGSGKTCH